MSKTGLTGDWHYGCTTHSSVDPETLLPQRLIDTERTIRDIFVQCAEAGVDRIIVKGDLFHTNNPPSTFIARFITLLAGLLDEFQIPVFAFDGNHDFNGKPGFQNATAALVAALGKHPLFNWIAKPTIVDFGDYQALMVPHKTWDGVPQHVRPNKPLVLVGHWVIEGAVSGVEESLLADDAEPVREIDAPVVAYWSGHVHKPQRFTYKGVPVVYPGSIERIDFGEREDEKRFVVAHREGDGFTYENFALASRRFVQITQVVDERWGDLDAVFWPNDAQDTVMKVRIKVKESDLVRFDARATRAHILRVCKPNYLAGFEMEVERERQVRDEEMTERLTVTDAFVRYTDRNLPTRTAKDRRFKEAVLFMGRQIIQEARG